MMNTTATTVFAQAHREELQLEAATARLARGSAPWWKSVRRFGRTSNARAMGRLAACTSAVAD